MKGHGGNRRALGMRAGIDPQEILDFSANINPLGPPNWLRRVISRHIEDLSDYPDPDAHDLRHAIADEWGLHASHVVMGNGANQLIHLLPRIGAFQRVLLCTPAYIDYAAAAEAAGLPVQYLPLSDQNGFVIPWEELENSTKAGDLLFLGHPNNPTGVLLDVDRLAALAKKCPDSVFVIDEAFIDFIEDPPTLVRSLLPNMVVLRSFTKFYAVPGLRLGCAVAGPQLASRIADEVPCWSVNSLAQAVGLRALQDYEYAARTRQLVQRSRQFLTAALSAVDGLDVLPSTANYVLCCLGSSMPDAQRLADHLLTRNHIAIRPCNNYVGLSDRYFRVAVRTSEESSKLVDALAANLGHPSRVRKPRQQTPAIMFQGTSSNAGKSIMAAAMCRVLLQDGVRVAPFKAQNMSNNSFAGRNGDEIARAQVVQAQACRMDPDVRISPILLKPCSDVGCQVIVNGKPLGNMNVREYRAFKSKAVAYVRDAYDALAADYDAIVLEGAGSPAEVNLKQDDIVNMRMASYAKSPVVLVGDIDRGGVFGSFVGCMEVLDAWERRLVTGFLVNKFRGDPSLLDDAFSYVYEHTGRPVLGTVPYIRNLGLPEEDSVTFKDGRKLAAEQEGSAELDVAVIDLPHVSNFTDLDPLLLEPDTSVRIVQPGAPLGRPDIVILPGSKNTLTDLKLLLASSTAADLRALTGQCEIVGICGGFQMLGRSIADPHGVEAGGDPMTALGLLPVDTEMAQEKILRQVETKHQESGFPVRGYEIHHGITDSEGLAVMVEAEDGPVAVASEDGMIWGSYLHGIFDADEFRRWFLDRARRRKGLTALKSVQVSYDLEPAFDQLAEVFRQHVDLDKLYAAMGL